MKRKFVLGVMTWRLRRDAEGTDSNCPNRVPAGMCLQSGRSRHFKLAALTLKSHFTVYN